MTVVNFPHRETADDLWNRYHALISQCFADPALWADRPHQEAVIRAHKRFCEAFVEEQGGACVEAG